MEINIPRYDGKSLKFEWEDDYTISCLVENNSVYLSANKDGLITLARHMLTLAQNEVPENSHIHLDEYTCLEKGSTELVIIRKDFL